VGANADTASAEVGVRFTARLERGLVILRLRAFDFTLDPSFALKPAHKLEGAANQAMDEARRKWDEFPPSLDVALAVESRATAPAPSLPAEGATSREELYAKVRDAIAAGTPHRKIAEKFGVSLGQISRVRNAAPAPSGPQPPSMPSPVPSPDRSEAPR
jgi:hypothetical protein